MLENFVMELAVMVVKTEDGVSKDGTNTLAYPAVVCFILPLNLRLYGSCLIAPEPFLDGPC
jgi:hypothetical protein